MTRIATLSECLLREWSYFGWRYAAKQGDPKRHSYFLPTAEYVASKFDGPLRVLEIGSWAGASAISWVKAFRELGRDIELHAVDHWMPYFDNSVDGDQHYMAMNSAASNSDIYKLFHHNLRAEGVSDSVKILLGDSREILPTLIENSYHLIYIDGSHVFETVLADLQNAKKLVVSGGVICGDDLEHQAYQLSDESIILLNTSLQDYISGPGKDFHPGVTRAVSDEFGKVQSWNGYWVVHWDGLASKEILLGLDNLSIPQHLQFIDRDKLSLFSSKEITEFLKKDFNLTDDDVVLLHEGVCGYNIIFFRESFYAVPQDIGPISFLTPDSLLPQSILVGDSFDCVVKKIFQTL